MYQSKRLNKDYRKHFRVSIFGSARIKDDDEVFKTIYELSRRIAARDIDVITGGGPGLMYAANAGHQAGQRNNKIHSIGLNIKLLHEQEANRHLDVKKEFETFSERLDNFMDLSHVVVVAPGGIGTTLELFYTWQLVQVKHIDTIPIILFDKMWKELVRWVERWPLKRGLLDKEDLDFLFTAETIDDVMGIIKEFHEVYLEGEDPKCADIKKKIK